MFFTITSVKLSRFRLNLVDFFLKYIFHKTVQTLLTYGSGCYGIRVVADDCLHLSIYNLRYTCISDFQVSPDSVKLVLGSGDNCLHCFVENVFEKKSTKFNLNRPSFMNVMVKTFLLCFLCPTV